MKFNLAKKRGKAKIKISDKRQAAIDKIMAANSKEFDIKLSVIQELIPLGLKTVVEELQNEVKQLAGRKYSRGTDVARWDLKMDPCIYGTRNSQLKFRGFGILKKMKKFH